MRRHRQLTLWILGFATILSAQSELKIGQWKSHLPYYVGRSITQSESTVYFASPWSIFMIDKDDPNYTASFLSKVEGLSDVGMGEIKYVPGQETLIACYANSNIDLIKSGDITNLPFIKEDPNIIGDRAIYNIFLQGDDLAYLACGFGVVELNVAREEFGFTTKMNLKVNDIVIYNNAFYAATEEGIYRAPNDGITNLQDFGNWELLSVDEGFPIDYSAQHLELYNNNLYIGIENVLYEFDGTTLTEVYQEEEFGIFFVTAENEHLILGMNCLNDCAGKVYFFDQSLDLTASGEQCVNRPHYAIEDQFGKVWYSDRWDRIRITDSAGGDCTRRNYNSPYTHDALEILVDDNEVYIATENPPANSRNGFYIYQDGEWEIYNGLFSTALREIRSVYRMAVHPETKEVFIGTFYNGLWVKNGDEYTRYDNTNSPLDEGLEEGRIRIGGMAFDQSNNLWMTNHTAQNPIVVRLSDGTWRNDFNIPTKGIQDMVIDQAGNKWCLVDGTSQGILVFNEGNIADPTDDQTRIITTSGTELPSNRVNSIAVDLDGDVWVGTDEGAVVFECGSSVFNSSSCRGSRRIVSVDDFNAYLLETESVRAIAVDGANRKWFGTTNGVFVQSPNGEEEVAHFNEDNSPLFDNEVTDIAINDNTGEVYIGTTRGLISVRAEATEGGPLHKAQVYAFPNPVQPEYDGPIAIKGLPRDADVKITDIRGQLIYEGQALGGQAIWDGRDYNGRKAASGVYLVFTTSQEVLNNPDAQVTKILFLK